MRRQTPNGTRHDSATSVSQPETPAVQPTAGLRILHIIALSSFALAQPLFSVLAQDATFFVAHDSSVWDLLLFAFAAVLAVPFILTLIQLTAAAFSATAGGGVHLIEIALLFAAIQMPILKNLLSTTSGSVVLAVATIGGCVFALLYHKIPMVRSWLTLISPAAAIFPIWFLFFTPVRTLVAAPPQIVSEQDGADSDIPIILVVFDELPVSSLMNSEGLLNGVRFPGFAKLAEDSWWFRNASSVAQSTSYALPAILSGRYPSTAGPPMLRHYPENLFTYLGSGYEQRVVEILTRLCPPELNAARSAPAPLLRRVPSLVDDAFYVYLHIILPTDLTESLPAIGATWRDFGGETDPGGQNPRDHTADSAWVFDYFLEQITETDTPKLYFLHLNLPHLPWKYLPSGVEYGPVGASIYPHGVCGEHWCGDEWESIQGWQRHLAQLLYADHLLERLISRLERHSLWDRSLVVVTSDHGVSFRSGQGRREITAENAWDVLAVPLFVKTPGQKTPEIRDRNVETIDILPTIADVIGAPLEWPVDGRSVFSPPERPDKTIFRSVRNKPLEAHVFPGDGPNVIETVERMVEHFGDGALGEDLYRIGPFSSLVGRDAAPMVSDESPPLEVSVEQTESFDLVDPKSGYLPAHIVGTIPIRETTLERLPLAVAINGTIRATTQTYGHREGIASFSALTPEDAWRPGHNQVEIFVVRGHPEAARLQSTHLATTTTYQLAVTSGDRVEAISDSNGRRIHVVPSAIEGEVDLKGLAAKGWAADLEAGQPADTLIVFRGSEFLFSTAVRMPRPAIAKREKNDNLIQCGFRFTLPSTFISDPGGRSPRFFAVSGDRASEILAEP